MDNNKIETISNLFEDKEIRSVWDSEKEEYFFSVVDVISALTDSNIPRNYWSDLKRKLKSEGSELHENIVQLKMKAQDGKMRETDTLDTKGIFRLIESVPSAKAEPFKLWLANLGSERIDEVFDPEIAVNRAVQYYRNKGCNDEWIITENHHEPIISSENFDKVQEILNKNKFARINKEKDLFYNFLKCADCGSSFTLRKVKNYEYYHCTSYVRNGSCTSHSIRKDKLTEIILEELNKKFKRNKIDTLTRDILLKNVDSIIISQNGEINVKFN